MKIQILTAMNHRAKVSDIFLTHTIPVMDGCGYDYGIHAVITANDNQSIEAAKRHGITYNVGSNYPLSNKWNHGLKALQKTKFDWLLILGDDDLISPEYFDYFRSVIDSVSVQAFGVPSIYFADTILKRGLYFSYFGVENRTIGAGRMFHRRLLDAVKWNLWPPGLRQSLDWNCQIKLQKAGIKIAQLNTPEPFIIDLKTGRNMWSFSNFVEKPGTQAVEYETIMHPLSYMVKQMISEL